MRAGFRVQDKDGDHMIEKDWMIGKVAIMYPTTIKVFQQYRIDVACCCGDGHMTLEQIALKLKVSTGEFLQTIERSIEESK
jgi:iron-sulfur cluster repair protein YtfE (RIC family)